MAKDNIYTDSRKRLIKGIQKVADVLSPSYGAAGSAVVIEELFKPFYRVTQDGKLIIDSIKLEDPTEQISKNILADATAIAERESGDSRKTTALLTSAILTESVSGINPIEVVTSLNECIKPVFDYLDARTKQTSVDQIKDVAMTSSGDEKISWLIRDIYEEIGKDGIIEIDTSGLPESIFDITEGFRIRAGCLGLYSFTEENKAVYKNPLILVSKEKVTSKDQLEPIFRFLKDNGKNELVLYVEDIDLSVLSSIAITHLEGGFKTLVIKAPVLWKDWMYEDLCKLTGATPVSIKDGKTFKSISAKDFGTCDKIVCTNSETRVIGTRDISAHIASLQELSKLDDQQKVRISWLQTKIAVLKVGGNSDIEIGRLIKKARDACSAAYWALNGGIVAGGGNALYNSISSLPDTIGGRILKSALKIPMKQIILNSGYVPWEEKKWYNKRSKYPYLYIGGDDFTRGYGWDARNKVLCNLFDKGIVDSAIITKNAVKNAISIAGTVLMAGSVITTPKEEHQSQPNQPLMR